MSSGAEHEQLDLKKPVRSTDTFSPEDKRMIVILLGITIGLLTALLLILLLPGALPTLAALFQAIGLPAFLGRIVIDLLGVLFGVLIAALLERAMGKKGDENTLFMRRLIIFTTLLTGVTLSFLIAAMYPVVFDFFVGLVGTGIGVYALMGLAGVVALGLAVGAVALIEWLVRRAMGPAAEGPRSKEEIMTELGQREEQRVAEEVIEASKNLPAGWKAYNGKTGVAYHNTITKQSQWDRPTAPAAAALPTSEAAPGAPQTDDATPPTTLQPHESTTVTSSDAGAFSGPEPGLSTDLPAQPLPAAHLSESEAGASHAEGTEFSSPIMSEKRPSQSEVPPEDGSPTNETGRDSSSNPSPSDSSI